MFPATCKKTPAMWHVDLWGQSASSSHGMNVSASRCALLTLKSTTDLNACGFEVSPARVTNSISPLSYRTSKRWHCELSNRRTSYDPPRSPQHRAQIDRSKPTSLSRSHSAKLHRS